MPGAEEQVMGLLPPLGCIPCHASSRELHDPCNRQPTDFDSHPAPWEGWLGKLSPGDIWLDKGEEKIEQIQG